MALTIQKYDLDKRKLDKVVEGVSAFDISANGEKMLYRQQQNWFIASTAQPRRSPAKAGSRRTTWRCGSIPSPSGTRCTARCGASSATSSTTRTITASTLQATATKYEPYLKSVAHRVRPQLPVRRDARRAVGRATSTSAAVMRRKRSVCRADCSGATSRSRTGVTASRASSTARTGTRVCARRSRSPASTSQAGEYLLAVNGRDLTASDNVYGRFENTADKSVVIKVGPNADGSNARET